MPNDQSTGKLKVSTAVCAFRFVEFQIKIIIIIIIIIAEPHK